MDILLGFFHPFDYLGIIIKIIPDPGRNFYDTHINAVGDFLRDGVSVVEGVDIKYLRRGLEESDGLFNCQGGITVARDFRDIHQGYALRRHGKL